MPINFYKKGSPHHHKAIARWFWVSTLMLATVIVCITSLHIQQVLIYSSLQQEKNELLKQLDVCESVAIQNHNQQALKEQLEKKLMKISRHTQDPKNPSGILKQLKTTLTGTTRIESISIQQKNIEIKITCDQTKTLTHITEKLCQHAACKNIRVISLEHKEKNRMHATLKSNHAIKDKQNLTKDTRITISS